MKKTLKKTFEQTLTDLKSLRDEIRLNLHLAGMDARSAWAKIEHDIEEAERWAASAPRREIERQVARLGEKVRQFRDRLHQGGKGATPWGG